MYFMRKGMLRTLLLSGVERYVARERLTCILEKYYLHLQGFWEYDGTLLATPILTIIHSNTHHKILLLPSEPPVSYYVIYITLMTNLPKL